jgi:hypothetical protein
MIQIENLTHRQKQIMDLLWTCRDIEQVQTLIRALPAHSDQRDAWSLVQIAMWESLEQQGGMEEYETAAKDCISRAHSPR